jgi:hypothetical protein
MTLHQISSPYKYFQRMSLNDLESGLGAKFAIFFGWHNLCSPLLKHGQQE